MALPLSDDPAASVMELARVWGNILRLGETPFGRIVQVLEAKFEVRDDMRMPERLFRARESLVLGREVSADDRRYVLRLAWSYRHLLDPSLRVYAALGSGCGDD